MPNEPTYEELEQRVQKLEKSEKELLFRSKQLESLINNNRFGIVSLDKDMRVIGCNKAFEDLFLYTQSEMEGNTLDELIETGAQLTKATAYTETTLKGESIQGSGERRRKDGTLVNVKFSGIPVTVDGEVMGSYGIYEDITERAQAEEALRDSEEKYRTTFESITDSITVTRMTDGQYQYVNDGFCHQTGYSREEVLGRTPSDINLYANPGERERFIGILQKDGKAENVVVSFRRKNGEAYYSEFSAKPIRYAGEECLLAQSRDISERKRAENELFRQKQRLDYILQGTNVGTWEWNVQTGDAVFNERWAEIIGYTLEELSPVSVAIWTKLCHPDDLKRSESLLDACFKGDSDFYHCECRMRHKNGDWVWVLDRGKVATWTKDDKPEWMFGTHQDITEKKNAEIEAATKTAFLDKLIDTSPEAVAILDPDYRITRINPEFTSLFGYTDTEAIGVSIHNLLVEESHRPEAIRIGTRASLGEKVDFEATRRRKDGRSVEVSILGGQVKIADEEKGIYVIYRDITERKRAENELRQNERYLSRILQTTLDGFWVLDQKGRVVDVNDAYCKMSGYARDEIIGLAITELDALESPSQTAERIERIMSKGSDAFEAEHRRKDGSIWPVEVSTTYLEEYGSSFVCFCRDMTERKRAEKDLLESENRLKLALEAVSDPVWDWQVDTNEIYLSPKWYTILGYEPYELPQEFETWRRLIHPDDREASERAVFQSLESGQAFAAEFRMRTKDNQWRWILGRGKVVQKDQNGEAIRMIGTNVDITSRKRAEEEILNQKKRAETYLNLAGVMFIALDLDGKVTMTNRHACKILECSESDIVGQDWFKNFLPKNVRCGTWNIFTKLVNGQIDQLEYSENSVISKSGKEKVIAWHNSQLKNPEGKITGVLSAGEDITEKRFLRERYKSIVRTAMDGFVRTDSIGGILEVNPAYCQMTGYNETELLQMNIEDLECHQSPEEVKQQIQKTIDAGQDRFQSQHRRKDGKVIDVEVIVQYRKEDAAQFVTFIRDISAQKAQERDLNFQAMLLDQIQDLVTATDMDGRIIYVNEAVCRNIKKKRDKVLGLSVESFGEDPEKGMTQKQIMERTKEHGQWRGEVVNYASDGTELIIDCRTKLIRNESGDPVSMVGISTDITEQKRISEFLQHAQKMESIGNLAGGIAHDFNNILFPILGMSELLLEDIPSDSLEHEKIRHIQKAAERGSNLVNQILAFSRLSEQKMIPIGIQHLIKEALVLIRSSIPSNIEISLDISKDCGLVNGDPGQIHQVLMNLVTNAYHAVEESGGSIAVNLKEVDIESEGLSNLSIIPGKYVRLTVSDTGCGIETAHLERIFEPYFTTKPQGKGTGFGLAVAYGIIKEHGGHIRVQSEPGKGSVFEVYLPLLEKVSETEPAVKSQSHPTGTERILIVDDESYVVQVEKQLLERLGYVVSGSTDIDDALAAFCANPNGFDLVITDMAMPKMTGLEFAGKLVSIRPDIPVILCTGFSERIREKNIKSLPIKALLKKPILKSRLANTVRDVLDGSAKV